MSTNEQEVSSLIAAYKYLLLADGEQPQRIAHHYPSGSKLIHLFEQEERQRLCRHEWYKATGALLEVCGVCLLGRRVGQ